jgi:hypothetical protein
VAGADRAVATLFNLAVRVRRGKVRDLTGIFSGRAVRNRPSARRERLTLSPDERARAFASYLRKIQRSSESTMEMMIEVVIGK